MTLTAKDVAQITRLLEESNFDELTLELDDLKLTLRRGGALPPAAPAPKAPGAQEAPRAPAAPAGEGATSHAPAAQPESPGTVPPREGSPTSPPAGAGGEVEAEGLRAVTAPLLGTFYRAPKPGAPPYVAVGSRVEPDTIIGIIEVMKLMNTVRAGVRGTVVDIAAKDGELVEYGETLLRLRTEAPG